MFPSQRKGTHRNKRLSLKTERFHTVKLRNAFLKILTLKVPLAVPKATTEGLCVWVGWAEGLGKMISKSRIWCLWKR